MTLASVALLTLLPSMQARYLRTEYLIDPLALQTRTPRFSWEIDDDRYGSVQSAYQIVVESGGKVVWDSRRTTSREQSQITYQGARLTSGQDCVWKVRLWDGHGKEGTWSRPAKFRTGLDPADWKGRWITADVTVPEVRPASNGYHSEMSKDPKHSRWIVVDLGSAQDFDEVLLHPARPFDYRDTPGFLFPVAYSIETAATPEFTGVTPLATARQGDKPGAEPVRVAVGPANGRYVRLTVSETRERDGGVFGVALAEIQVLSKGKVVSQGATVSADSSIENGVWGVKRLTDGDTVSHNVTGLDSLPVQYLRKDFDLDRKVRKAVLYATALGLYEARLNGRKVGDRLLSPEWTDYRTRVQYQAYDVTGLLKQGGNRWDVALGDGWYAGRIGMSQSLDPRRYPRAVYGRRTHFLGQIELEYTDGTKAFVPTDSTWIADTDGPIRSADLYDGERTVLGQEAFEKGSVPVRTADGPEEGFRPELVAQTNEAIRLVERIRPLSVTEPKPGVYVLDMGQNMVGWIRARMTAKQGAKVVVQYAEMLNEDGTVYTENLRGAPQRDTVEFSQSTTAEWHPRFTYHGFRYVSIEGLSEKPDVTDVTGEVFCSSSKETARFDTSNPMVDRLWQNIFWTQRANLMSSPTDCPQRDERLGWMGDILAFAQTAYFNMDMSGFFTKWLQDVRDAQADNGMYPDFAPHPYGKNDRFTGVPGWGDAGVVCAWVHYRNTGDTALLAAHYPSMKRWVDWISSKNPDGVWTNERHNDYGDWLNGNTLVRDGWDATGSEMPKDAFATTMWYQSADMVSKTAAVLGHKTESREYRAMADKVKTAFQKAYVGADGRIKGDTQAGYAMALYLGLVPAGLEKSAFDHMVHGIEARGGHMTTGFHSTLPMMDVLSRNGRTDIAYTLLLNTTFPSWGYTIQNGATTIWERWDGYVKGRGFQDPGMNSFNHWALGSVGEWMMKKVGGIAPGDPGWATSIVAPTPGPGIEWSKASYLSPRGQIDVSWKVEAGRLRLEVSVPANTTCRVLVPGPEGAKIEVGPDDSARAHAKVSGRDGWATAFEVGSGRFTFTTPYGP